MAVLDLAALLLTLAAVFSYINYRYIGMPTAIGIMLIAIVMSLVVVGLGYYFVRRRSAESPYEDRHGEEREYASTGQKIVVTGLRCSARCSVRPGPS